MHKTFNIYQSDFEAGFDTFAEAAAAAEQLEESRWIITITEERLVARSGPIQPHSTTAEVRTSKSLQWYLALGEALSKAARKFASTKYYGQHLAAEFPESQALDPALRSNCKWLFEHHDEVVRVLMPGGSSLNGYKTANPTVIRREYKAAMEKAAKAKESVEEAETADEELG